MVIGKRFVDQHPTGNKLLAIICETLSLCEQSHHNDSKSTRQNSNLAAHKIPQQRGKLGNQPQQSSCIKCMVHVVQMSPNTREERLCTGRSSNGPDFVCKPLPDRLCESATATSTARPLNLSMMDILLTVFNVSINEFLELIECHLICL